MSNNELREKLIDEKSQIIFDARMNYKKDKRLTSFYQLLKKNGEKYIFREVDEYIRKSGLTKIYIWGNDDFSLYSYYVLKDADYFVRGLISDNSNGQADEGICIPLDEIEQELKDVIVILFDRDLPNIPCEVLDRGNTLKLFSHVVGRTGNQYFDFFSSNGKEYFVDAGALDGETSKKFIKWCGGNYGAIYSFEANPLMAGKCKEQLEQITNQGNLFFYERALWDKKDTVCFDNTGSKWDAHVCDNGGTLVKADSIDNLLENRKVTLIKFDVEGSEIKALLGAYNCILQNRPRMAISVYHNDTDLENIMNYLIGLKLDYKFALRHYHSDSIETILYVF